MFFRFIHLLPLALLLSAQAAEPVRVFLFAGQSNMEGADTDPKLVETFPPFKDALKPFENVRYSFQCGANHKSNGWTDLQPVGNNFGPEITFARAFRRQSKAPLAIVKDAWGGTTLVNDWAPGGGDEKSKKLYNRFITQVRDRLTDLTKEGLTYQIEALVWHQGENDMFHREGKNLYEKNLRNFIAHVRKDLSVPDLKVYIGEISTKGIWGMDNRTNVALIRKQQMAVVESDPNVTFVPTSHLSFKVGRPFGLHYHFGTLGQLQHGEAYAKSYFAKPSPIKEQKTPVVKAIQAKLFILGGQRNMEGEEAWLSELKKDPKTADLVGSQPALFRYDLGGGDTSNGWQFFKPAAHLGNFGPELSFAKKIITTRKYDQIHAIYKFTDSGSQSLDWLPGGSKEKYRDRYQLWINGIKESRDSLLRDSYDCEIQAIFWHCGENDRALTWMADKYAARFQTFMNATRKDLGLPNLPFILTEQPPLPSTISGDKKLYDLNADLEALAAKDPNFHFIKTADLPHGPVLFGTQGTIALGERMADAWLKIQN